MHGKEGVADRYMTQRQGHLGHVTYLMTQRVGRLAGGGPVGGGCASLRYVVCSTSLFESKDTQGMCGPLSLTRRSRKETARQRQRCRFGTSALPLGPRVAAATPRASVASTVAAGSAARRFRFFGEGVAAASSQHSCPCSSSCPRSCHLASLQHEVQIPASHRGSAGEHFPLKSPPNNGQLGR